MSSAAVRGLFMVYQHESANGRERPDTYTAAQTHLAKGRFPVPIPYGKKAPNIVDWQLTEFTAEAFVQCPNIGLKFGKDLLDVDCDHPYIVALAPHFLPTTGMRHGRPSKPNSHYWYRIDGDGEYVKFYADTKDAHGTPITLLELRSGPGLQTVIPPSTYQLNGSTPEQLVWENGQEGEETSLAFEEALLPAEKMAAIALIALHWGGARHNIALSLAGYLVRGGVEDEAIYDIISRVCWLTRDEEAEDRRRAAQDTIEKYRNGETVLTGGKTLKALIGKEAVNKISKWLHLKPVLEETAATVADLYKYEANDVGNAEAVRALHGESIRYTTAVGWLTHAETHWIPESEEIVDQAIIDTLRKRRAQASARDLDDVRKKCALNDGNVVACRKRLRALPDIKVDINEFNNVAHLINTADGVVDLRTGDLVSHASDQRFTYCLHTGVGTEEDAAPFVHFLREAVGGDEEMVRYIQAAVGYSITGDISEECLFYIHGPTRGGKGTFIETCLKTFDGPLCHASDFGTFTGKRRPGDPNYDLAELQAARFVTAAESDRSDSLNPGLIKKLTGGNLITAQRKYHHEFNFWAQFHLWFESNWPCSGDPDDDAMWARVRIIHFPNSYLGREDLHLKHALRSEQVRRGVLWWAVQGAVRRYKEGLQTPQSVLLSVKEHRSLNDYVQQWIDDYGITVQSDNPDMWESSENLRRSYELWCANNGVEKTKGPKALALSLQRKGVMPVRGYDATGKQGRGFQGIKLPEKRSTPRSSSGSKIIVF